MTIKTRKKWCGLIGLTISNLNGVKTLSSLNTIRLGSKLLLDHGSRLNLEYASDQFYLAMP